MNIYVFASLIPKPEHQADLETELRRSGLAAAALPQAAPTELEGAQRALAWARPGDVIALTVHAASARSAVIALLAEPPDARLA